MITKSNHAKVQMASARGVGDPVLCIRLSLMLLNIFVFFHTECKSNLWRIVLKERYLGFGNTSFHTKFSASLPIFVHHCPFLLSFLYLW